jgi:hypothetical protein
MWIWKSGRKTQKEKSQHWALHKSFFNFGAKVEEDYRSCLCNVQYLGKEVERRG